MIVIIVILIFLALLAFICIFFKGATKLANEYDEKMEAEMIIRKIEEEKNNNGNIKEVKG